LRGRLPAGCMVTTSPAGVCLLAPVAAGWVAWDRAVHLEIRPARDTGLSDRQQRILNHIRAFIEAHGYPPTLREIARAVGLRSTSSAQYQVGVLADRGFVEPRAPGRTRALRLVRPGKVA
jgi:LexA DNA binding domain